MYVSPGYAYTTHESLLLMLLWLLHITSTTTTATTPDSKGFYLPHTGYVKCLICSEMLTTVTATATTATTTTTSTAPCAKYTNDNTRKHCHEQLGNTYSYQYQGKFKQTDTTTSIQSLI